MAAPLALELRCRQHEQDVAGPEHDGAELAGQVVVVAADREDRCVVPGTEPRLAQCAPGQFRTLGHDRFEEPRIEPVAGADEVRIFRTRQTPDLEQVDHVDDVTGEIADVTSIEHRAGPRRDDGAAAFHPGEEDTVEMPEAGGIDRAAHERPVRVDAQGDRVGLGGDGGIGSGTTAAAQQSGRGQHEHGDADRCDGQADPGDLEHAERIATLSDEQIRHDEVGRCADHRDHAAEHRGVGQRDQIRRRRHVRTAAPRDHTRRSERDEWCVRQHRRQRAGGDGQPCETGTAALRPARRAVCVRRAFEHPIDHRRQRPGHRCCTGEHVERGDRDRRRRRQARQGLGLIDDVGEQEHADGGPHRSSSR